MRKAEACAQCTGTCQRAYKSLSSELEREAFCKKKNWRPKATVAVLVLVWCSPKLQSNIRLTVYYLESCESTSVEWKALPFRLSCEVRLLRVDIFLAFPSPYRMVWSYIKTKHSLYDIFQNSSFTTFLSFHVVRRWQTRDGTVKRRLLAALSASYMMCALYSWILQHFKLFNLYSSKYVI